MQQKILVVEDSDLNRSLLQVVLAYHGYEVLLAPDGAEGVRMAREHHPDLILMDIQMAGMNGIEAGSILRSDPLTKGIRMLALSAFTLQEDKDDFFSTGFDGHIEKPIDIRRLPETVRKHLPDGERP